MLEVKTVVDTDYDPALPRPEGDGKVPTFLGRTRTLTLTLTLTLIQTLTQALTVTLTGAHLPRTHGAVRARRHLPVGPLRAEGA